MGWNDLKVEGAEVKRVRVALGEDQTKFGARFGKTRRTVIRWEKGGASFSRWGEYRRDPKTGVWGQSDDTPEKAWLRVAALADAKAAKKAAKQKKAPVTSARSRAARRRRRVSQRGKK